MEALRRLIVELSGTCACVALSGCTAMFQGQRWLTVQLSRTEVEVMDGVMDSGGPSFRYVFVPLYLLDSLLLRKAEFSVEQTAQFPFSVVGAIHDLAWPSRQVRASCVER